MITQEQKYFPGDLVGLRTDSGACAFIIISLLEIKTYEYGTWVIETYVAMRDDGEIFERFQVNTGTANLKFSALYPIKTL